MSKRSLAMKWGILSVLGAAVLGPRLVRADDDLDALKARLAALEKKDESLRARVEELEKKDDDNWMAADRAEQIRRTVEEVLADAKSREPKATPLFAGYQDGFVLQTEDHNYKLVVGGVLQVRYEAAFHYVNNAAFKTKPLPQGNSENSSGFDIRRARVNFTGNVFSPNLFYRLEGDFYGSSTGGFTVTDAYAGYVFNDYFKIRAGAFKTPFTKAELVYDANLELERSEVNFPFDAQRSLGLSLFGDIIKDRLGYEVNMNDGSKTNTLRYVDTNNTVTTITSTASPTSNLDNRMGYYARLQYAGSGKISEFYEGGESDLREDTSPFIWMLGGAGGYESQNSSAAAYSQNTLQVVGLGSNNSPGFAKAYALNGDIYRATLDWSAKWRGLSINTAAYFQQVNANPFAAATGSGLPYEANKASFFQHGYSAQVGYMVLPRRLEVVGRAGLLFDEGDPNIAEFYTLGANYFLYGNNAKVSLDISYSPETAYTDAATLQIANTRDVLMRLQLQLKF